MATTDPTRTPPAVGKTLSVKVTPELYDDLAVIMSTGVTASDAVRRAVAQVADLHRTAWAHGMCAPGITPVIDAYSIRRQPGNTPPTSPYDAPANRVGRPITPPSYPAARRTTVEGSGA
jgi:hypothetical protein